jgi:hypothetical protein
MVFFAGASIMPGQHLKDVVCLERPSEHETLATITALFL